MTLQFQLLLLLILRGFPWEWKPNPLTRWKPHVGLRNTLPGGPVCWTSPRLISVPSESLLASGTKVTIAAHSREQDHRNNDGCEVPAANFHQDGAARYNEYLAERR